MRRTDGLLGLAFPAVQAVQSIRIRLLRGVTLGVRGLVVDEAGAVLLVRHSYVPGWHLPGGAVEPGEAAAVSLARELREEAGVDMVGEPRLLGLFFNERMRRRDHVALFHVPAFERPAPFRPGLEIREARFFPREDLPATTSDATRRRLAEHFDGAPVSPHW